VNRVIFTVLFIAIIVIPISSNMHLDDIISDSEFIKKIESKFLPTTTVVEAFEIKLTEQEKTDLKVVNEKINNLEKNVYSSTANILDAELVNINNKVNEFVAFYNYEQFTLKNNGIKGLYLNGYHYLVKDKIEPIFQILESTDVNTVVIDVKTDNGHLLYESEIEEVLTLNNIRKKFSAEDLINFKNSYEIYLIGRVVAFQDPIYAQKYPTSAILDLSNGQPYSQDGQFFLDPSDDLARKYILNVAIEACELGFDEIQLDYIRYPDTNNTNLQFDEESTLETRTKNINSFLFEVREELHARGCLLSADIFGYVLIAKNDNGIGQLLESLLENVDFISPMVYPSHYSKGSYGFSNPNSYPYEIITASLNDGLKRGVDKVKLRPFLQGFWHTDEQVRLNIKAAEDLGVGWLLWNNVSNYNLEYFAKLDS